MKNCNFLFKVILLVVCFSMSLLTVAQVRIGGETLPEEGATLDLNPVSSGDYRGGLLLPNVEILNLDFIPISFTDAASMAGYDAIDGVDENVALTGMMVYHVPGSGNSIAEGVYVWVGSEWLPITRSISCKAPNITVPSAAQTISVYMGTAVELSVTATGNNLTYQWYKNNSAISGATSANYNAIASDVNNTEDIYYCLVISNCEGDVTGSANSPTFTVKAITCGAYVSASEWREFMCHNLGADENLNPFTPAEGLNGDYYQFGGKSPAATKDAIIGTWSSTAPQADSNDWDPANDPCPTGFRLPTQTEWSGVLANNTISRPAGASWSESETNFTSGISLGSNLFLPAAGERNSVDGTLRNRDMSGYYWSRSANGSAGYRLYFSNSYQNVYFYNREYVYSVRCIAKSAAELAAEEACSNEIVINTSMTSDTMTFYVGTTIEIFVYVNDSDVTYQWYLNGEAIIGAIYSSCMATASFTNDIQSYQCVVTKRCVEGVIGSAASPVFYIQSTSSNRIPGVGELSIP